MAPDTFESRAKRPRRVKGCSIARRRDTTAIDETHTFGGYPRVESRRREAPGQSRDSGSSWPIIASIIARAWKWKKLTSTRCALTTPVRVARAPRRTRRPTTASSLQPSAAMSADEVRASHLLVKHQGSRRPASWRDPDGQHIPKKTKEAALDELMAYKEQIESGAVSFADLAAKVSDCSSAKHGGDLGFFGRGKMQKAFEVRPHARKPPEDRPQRDDRDGRSPPLASEPFETQLSTTTHRADAMPVRIASRPSTRSSRRDDSYPPRRRPLSDLRPTSLRRTAPTRSRWARCPRLWTRTAACTSSFAPRETTRSARVAVVNARELSVNVDDRIRARTQTRA